MPDRATLITLVALAAIVALAWSYLLAAPMPMPEEPIGPEEPLPEEGMALPWIPILAVAGTALLALIIILIVVRRARHRKAAQADADLLASMDAEPLISED